MAWNYPHPRIGPSLFVVDDLIRNLAEEDNQTTLVAYPKEEQGLCDYARFTARKIDAYVSDACERLVDMGLLRQTGVREGPSVIGLIGPSNLEYLITMFALSRLGYTVLMLSPRLPVHAYDSLLEETQCATLVSGFDLVAGLEAEKVRSEAGTLMQSHLLDGAPWNFLRIIPSVRPYIWMKEIGGGVCELVILDGLKSKTSFNSEDPPNSFHTKDLFVAHHVIRDSWKHVGRLDDRLTLTSGEKVLPLPIEGRIRQHPRVREAVVFGIGRAFPGLLLFRSKESKNIPDRELIDAIWTTVEDANSRAERFSMISRETIVVLPVTRDYPQTDKGTIVRAQLYQDFAPEISSIYERLESPSEGSLTLDIDDLKKLLLQNFRERLNIRLADFRDDFFAAGVDSIQATRMLSFIKKEVYLNGKDLSTAAVYNAGNIEQLARYLHNLRTGIATENGMEEQISSMAELIEKYSRFDRHISKGRSSEDGYAVLLTGATGFLGSYILVQLLRTQAVSRVYCLVRASSLSEARARLLSSPHSHLFLNLNEIHLNKIQAILDSVLLNIVPSLPFEGTLPIKLTHIIHCAWPTNFNHPLPYFIPQFGALQNLLQLSLFYTTPAHFIFCSSVSAASLATSPVPEAAVPSLAYAANTGYGRSKLVAEKIIQRAIESAGAHATILRLGQIIGDGANAAWSVNDAIPLLVRSALTIHALPALNEQCAWLPVDTVAASVMEIAGLATETSHAGNDSPSTYVLGLVNPHTFSWTREFLPALQAAGLRFDIIEPREWLRKLRESDMDVVRNPTVKLLDFWSTRIEAGEAGRGGKSQGKGEGGEGVGNPLFENAVALRRSPALRRAPDIIAEGYVRKVLRSWLDGGD